MAVYKQFNTNQVVVAPFNANKQFAYSGNSITASDVGIEYYQGQQGKYISGSYPTGFTTILDGVLVFNSVKQLYYSNYLTQSTGDLVVTGSLVPGASADYNEDVGPPQGPRFENFLQSSVTQSRYFAQFSGSTNPEVNDLGPAIISIPSKLFGEVIPPGEFQFEYTSSLNHTRSLVKDDGEGNLIATQSNSSGQEIFSGSVGQIFYSQGIAIFTGPDSGSLSSFPFRMGVGGGNNTINNNVKSSSIQFSSSIQIRENQYKCVIRDNEFSYTTNPSALRPLGELNLSPNQLSQSISTETYNDGGTEGVFEIALQSGATSDGSGGSANFTIAADGTISDISVAKQGRGYNTGDIISALMSTTGGTGTVTFKLTIDDVTGIGTTNSNETYYDFATGSYFSPYVTTIGLYNESFQLLAVGKLSNAIPISLYTDTTFVVNFDTW
jgi:hypothetical protein